MDNKHRDTVLLILLALSGILLFCAVKAPQCGEPKTVYLPIAGVSDADTVQFSCYLKRGSRESETKTSRDLGFDHLRTEDGKVNHLSIQCGNFHVMQWSPGDRLMIEIAGRKGVTVRLDAEGEQYAQKIS